MRGGPPVTAMLIQNTNPVSVAPDQKVVKRGFAREDLFVCVHEQFMTETATMADIVLPATMFLEHDDIYQGGGSQYILLGPKLVEPPGECRSNHDVICALAKRLGAQHPGFDMTPRELIDWTLQQFRLGHARPSSKREHWIDCQPPFERAHYLDGFNWPDGKFRFKPDWPNGAVPQPACTRARSTRCRRCRIIGSVDRGGRRGASVPARDLAGARLPQLDLQRDADLAGAGRRARP